MSNLRVRSMCYQFMIFAVMIFGLILAFQGVANAVNVYVGYADNLRPDAPSAFFPSPWFGDSSVALFVGNATNVDAGAVMITNTGLSSITINSISVQLQPSLAGPTFALWGASLPFVLNPGLNAIFTQTTQYNFDTSDPGFVAQNILDNCSVGPTSTTSLCIDNAPAVNITIDSVLANLRDTGHVLDTGGFDAVCCLPQGNESLNWRLIGTTGVDNPNGTVPEPASLLLFGSGLVGLGLWRKFKA